jgi:hypothetical protein
MGPRRHRLNSAPNAYRFNLKFALGDTDTPRTRPRQAVGLHLQHEPDPPVYANKD